MVLGTSAMVQQEQESATVPCAIYAHKIKLLKNRKFYHPKFQMHEPKGVPTRREPNTMQIPLSGVSR